MRTRSTNPVYDNALAELRELDKETVKFHGIQMKPSQCYKFSFHPPHVLFNTNCPDSLKEKVLAILKKYFKEVQDDEQHSGFN